MNQLDSREFRNALGQFATGVTVITSIDAQKKPVGVTASSFNSVSIEPPLVLWSLAKNSGSLQAFQESGCFCVHVLASGHQELSQRFASRGTDKFADIEWQPGVGGAPLLNDFAAQFQCKTTYQYEGGDHVIFVGEVVDYQTRDEQPLVFHKGSYARAKAKQQVMPVGDAIDIAQGKFSENFFLYLLSRAHYQASMDLNFKLQQDGIRQSQYLALTALGLLGEMAYQDLHAHLEHTANAPSIEELRHLQDSALLTETPDGAKFSLTVKGRAKYIELLAISKASEQRLLADFDDEEIADVRDFLQRFIKKSGAGVPSFWNEQE